MFNWKKKTSIFIGRFQPFHLGHKKIFLKTLKNTDQVAILVMNSHNVGTKNPLSFQQVKRKINDRLKKYKKKYIIIKIPVVGEFVYGRKVGYKVKKIIDRKTTKISGSKIRAYAKQKFGQKYIKVLSKINVNDLRKIES